MSSTYRTYVGPYIACAVSLSTTILTHRACTNTSCVRHRQLSPQASGFCAVCGAPWGDVPYAQLRPSVSQQTVFEELHERLSHPMGDAYHDWTTSHLRHLWLPNVEVPALRHNPRLATVGFAVTPLRDPATDIAILESFFCPEIVLLRQWYGAESVTTGWGAVQDYC